MSDSALARTANASMSRVGALTSFTNASVMLTNALTIRTDELVTLTNRLATFTNELVSLTKYPLKATTRSRVVWRSGVAASTRCSVMRSAQSKSKSKAKKQLLPQTATKAKSQLIAMQDSLPIDDDLQPKQYKALVGFQHIPTEALAVAVSALEKYSDTFPTPQWSRPASVAGAAGPTRAQ